MSEIAKNDRREIAGWLIYDWANSAFYTTVIAVLLGPYLTALAQSHVGKNGTVLSLGWLGNVTAEQIFPYSISLSVGLQFFVLPLLGAIADYTNLKKRLMAIFCYLGVAASCALFFITGDNYLLGCALLVIANLGFGASIVFYNAYLVDLTSEDRRDAISSYGFAAGYIGGIVMLIANIALINYAETLGLTRGLAVRISLLIAGIWWGAFALATFALLKSRGAAKRLPPDKNVIAVGVGELVQTFRELLRLRYTALFLLGYLFYNDGIQTVINSASIFLAQELFVARGLIADESFLLGIFLVAQISALVGSIAFERIARIINTKNTIILSLVIWIGIVIFAYGFLQQNWQAWIFAVFVGMVLGSSQALSRSLYSQMIPPNRESAFFSFYEVSERGTSWIGPFVFAQVVGYTGSYRQAILALAVFFVVGIVILLLTDTDRAVAESKR